MAASSAILRRRGDGVRRPDDAAADEIEHGRKHHQDDEPGLPPAVEHVARERQKGIAPPRQQVVHGQHQRQEIKEENMRGEDQGYLAPGLVQMAQ